MKLFKKIGAAFHKLKEFIFPTMNSVDFEERERRSQFSQLETLFNKHSEYRANKHHTRTYYNHSEY